MGEALVRVRAAVMHRRLEEELDALVASGVLLDPAALARLRALLDEAMPTAVAYADHLADLGETVDEVV